MQGTSIMKNSVKILLCILLLLVLVQAVQAAEAYVFVTKWGTSGNGSFYEPWGVAVDTAGNVYVADSENQRVQKISQTGIILKSWGTQGHGDGQFEHPYNLVVDPSGNVLVSDTDNHRIQKFSSDGTFLGKWGGSYGTGDGQFKYPTGITVDNVGNVYVADTWNHRIQKFRSDGTFLGKWGSNGTGDGQFYAPGGVAVDSSGNVYVADLGNNRIQKFSSDWTFITKWGTQGTTDGQFNMSRSNIVVDPQGGVYVSDSFNNRIQKFRSDGTFISKWGSYGTGDGQFKYPTGITVDNTGNVYVADSDNNRIQKFAPAQSLIAVSSITPSTAINTSTVSITDLIGTGFMSGATANLIKTGRPDITATGVSVVSPTKISCTFDLTGKDAGPWNVVVTNPDGTSATLPHGFTITGVVPPTLSVTAISPSTGTNDQSISATVTGTGFKPGAVVKLMLTGQPDIVASGMTLTGNSTLTCTFDLTGKTTGIWDLAVTNPSDGTTSVRSTAFTLTTAPIITNTTGTIIVSTTPQDALVYLDGSLKGTGSVTLKDVSPGYHSVRVTKTMYNDYVTDVRVAAGSPSYIIAVLTPVTGVSGTIIASSNPPGASVYIDGVDKGISPVTITGVSSGSHTVSFTKTGYTAASRSVTMTAGQTMDITVDLTKTGGDWGDLLNTTNLIIVGIVVLIIVIIGVLLRKKKNRWDNY